MKKLAGNAFVGGNNMRRQKKGFQQMKGFNTQFLGNQPGKQRKLFVMISEIGNNSLFRIC